MTGEELLEVAPVAPVRAVLALGSNLGDRRATLQSAVEDLAGYEGVRVTAVSAIVETDPWGGVEQPDYLNAVVLVQTALSPLDLLAVCQAVETGHGRERRVRWGARTLDVDVVDYRGVTADTRALTLPHPRAHERAFVLVPWSDVEPDAALVTPDGEALTVTALLDRVGREGVRASDAEPLAVPR